MNRAVQFQPAKNADTLRGRFPQRPRESLLFEMMISGQRFPDSMPLHQYEAYRVAEGIGLVQALAE
jgi:hypothetical protein